MSKEMLCDSATRYLMALQDRIRVEIDNLDGNIEVGDFKVDSCTSYIKDRLEVVVDQIRESIRRIDDYENCGENGCRTN